MARVLKDYPNVSLKLEHLDGQVDFAEIFGRAAPVHVEIGCGKAAFLLNQAKAEPQANFLGIEWARKYYRYAVDRIGRWGLTNVRIIRIDAGPFIAQFVPDSSVDCYHLYFPDPWPKKRHHKRRFFRPENLEQLIRTLKPGGQIRVVTDHQEYFQLIRQLFEQRADVLCPIDFVRAAGAQPGEWVGTNFERKYRLQNRPVYPLAVQKRS